MATKSRSSKTRFKKISERSKSEFKPRKETRGVTQSGGRAAPKQLKQEIRRRGSYVDYLRGMTGRNKSVPLTPEQWKKTGKL